MFKNYLKIAFRSLLRNKGFSFINIFGLAIGITCASIIFLWVENEVNYDSVFPNKDQIYNLLTNQKYKGKTYTFNATPGTLAQALKDEVPGIIYATRVTDNKRLFSFGDKAIYKNGLFVDPDFLKIFSLKFIEGNIANAFTDVKGIVLTHKTAIQIFGKQQNIIGKTLRLDNNKNYKITGVVADLPENVTLKFNWIAPFASFAQGKDYLKHWGENSVATYIELAKNADVIAISKTIKKIIPTNTGDKHVYAILQSMNNWHLRDSFKDGVQKGGRYIYVDLFSLIAWVILIIACINFMNLSTSRSIKRANEVGVRKVLGAGRKRLIIQFLSEAMFIAAIATLVSIFLIYLFLPQFNIIVGKHLNIGLSNPLHILALVCITLFCGIFAGIYPAFYLSTFKPVDVLSGLKAKHGGALFIRKGLVITQFTASIIFIISTIVVYKQIQHVKNRPIGYDKDNLITIDVRGNMIKNFNVIKQDLIATGMVQNAALTNINTLYGGNNGWGATWSGMDENSHLLITYMDVSPKFISTTRMKIFDGRDFYSNPKLDSTNILITESLAKLMGKGSAVGKKIYFGDDSYEVIGVVKNFLYGDMYGESDPVIFFNNTQDASLMYVKINSKTSVKKAIENIGKVMKKDNPSFPFEYKFLDDTFNAMFSSEMLVGKLSELFAILAILISSLGLLGLAGYTSEQRSKEIGIRKVLGAKVTNIVTLLSKDFLKLVFISIVIAIPIAWWVMSTWLQKYAYHINMHWWIFALAGFSAILIALLTVSFQALKSALTNPVKSLRKE